MFGKFKKKVEDKVVERTVEKTPNSKVKQKNDLFTLLEESPEKNLNSNELKAESKNTKPEAAPKTTTVKPEAAPKTTTVKPEAAPKTTTVKPEAISKNDSSDKSKFDDIQKIGSDKFIPESSIKGDKSQLLLLEIEKLHDKTIKPVVDFNENCLFYPILSKIGQSPDDVSFLDDLAADGTLDKTVFEKLIICPDHPDAFSSSVMLYCPKCNSINVEKLNLYEHKRCGFITENTDYDFSNPANSTCPSCKRQIADFKKEIRIPAMWHQCIDCKEKFDNAIIKLYCRQHEHDFDINAGHFVTTYSYRLKDYDAPITSDDDKMHEDLVKLLNGFNFTTEFKSQVRGKSGNSHRIPIYAKNNANQEAIAIFILRQIDSLTQTEINSILVPILDVGPKHTLLLTTAEVDDGVKPVAKQYGIDVISDPDLTKIIQFVDEFVSKKYSRNGET